MVNSPWHSTDCSQPPDHCLIKVDLPPDGHFKADEPRVAPPVRVPRPRDHALRFFREGLSRGPKTRFAGLAAPVALTAPCRQQVPPNAACPKRRLDSTRQRAQRGAGVPRVEPVLVALGATCWRQIRVNATHGGARVAFSPTCSPICCVGRHLRGADSCEREASAARGTNLTASAYRLVSATSTFPAPTRSALDGVDLGEESLGRGRIECREVTRHRDKGVACGAEVRALAKHREQRCADLGEHHAHVL